MYVCMCVCVCVCIHCAAWEIITVIKKKKSVCLKSRTNFLVQWSFVWMPHARTHTFPPLGLMSWRQWVIMQNSGLIILDIIPDEQCHRWWRNRGHLEVFGFRSNNQIRLALQQSFKLPYISYFPPYPTLIGYVSFSSLNTTLILCVMPQGRERECTDPQRAHPNRNATCWSVVWRQADHTER